MNNKDTFRIDNNKDFPPVIIILSINDKVDKVEEKPVRVKGGKIV